MSKNFAVSVSIKAIDEVTSVINRVTGNISRQHGAMKKMNEFATVPTQLQSTISDFKSEWSGITNSLETKSFFKGISDGTSHAAAGLKSLGSAATDSIKGLTMAGFALGGVSVLSAKMFGQISQSNVELKHSAMGLGVSPDILRSHRLAAESFGVSGGSIDGAFQRLNQIGFEFRAGNHAAAAPLAALPGGLHLLGSGNKQKSPEILLKEVLDKLKNSGLSEITKAQLLNGIVGSSELLPLAHIGGHGLSEKARTFQGESYGKSDQAASRYLQANTQFKGSLEQLGRVASIEILPGIAKGLDRISEWISTHGDKLKGLFSDIGESIPKEMGRALWFLSAFASGLAALSKYVGVSNVIFTTLSLTIGGKLLVGFMEIGKALKYFGVLPLLARGVGLLWAALSAPVTIGVIGPILAAVAVVGLITAAIFRFRKQIFSVTQVASGFFTKIFTAFANWVVESIKPITDAIESLSSLFGKKLEISAPKISSGYQPDFLANSTGKTDFLDQILQSNQKKESGTKAPGELTVRFENLPKGARIEEKKGDIAINYSAGYTLYAGYA